MDIGKECIGLICVVSKGWCIHTGELGGPLGCQRHFSSPPRHQPSKQDVGIKAGEQGIALYQQELPGM